MPAADWVLVVNQNTSPVYYEIYVAGQLETSGTLSAGAHAAPLFPGVMGGPVRVKAWTDSSKQTPANVVASQRENWGPSFEEVPGYPESALLSDYNWPWYDNQSSGATDWVLVVNPKYNLSLLRDKDRRSVKRKRYTGGRRQCGAYLPWNNERSSRGAGLDRFKHADTGKCRSLAES